MLNATDLAQELRDNKSHTLVTLLDFADQVKNQTRDGFYRGRVETIIADLSSLRDKATNSASGLAKELEIIINDLNKLKKETTVELRQNGRTDYLDYHKAGIEYLKKRIHCEINNSDRRLRLALGISLEKQKIQPLEDA